MTLLDDLKTQYKTGDISQKLLYWNIALFVIPEVVKAVVHQLCTGCRLQKIIQNSLTLFM